ncbi:MAG: AsmA family protein [Phycisphaerales bacterium]|nr:MAG: AsmA family protein [Phycisphaerales bacterium]
MKKLGKFLSIVLSVVVILIVLVILAVGLFANNALDMAIESAGTRALNVGVRVSEVDLSILRGKLGIRNLVINNPPGYQHDELLELAEGQVTVETRSLLSDVVKIKDMKLDGMDVVLEQRGVSSNNLQDIIRELPPRDKRPSEPGGKKLHVDNLEITDVEVLVKLLPVPGKVDTLTIKLAPIRMTDLGSKDDVDTAALSRKVLLAIAGKIAEQGAGLLPDEMLGSLVSELGKFSTVPDILLKTGGKLLKAGTDAGKGARDAGKSVGEGVMKDVEDVGKGIGDGLKSILKEKEKED